MISFELSKCFVSPDLGEILQIFGITTLLIAGTKSTLLISAYGEDHYHSLGISLPSPQAEISLKNNRLHAFVPEFYASTKNLD